MPAAPLPSTWPRPATAGVRTATLFAASDAAVASYASLGFARIGSFALVLFAGPVTP